MTAKRSWTTLTSCLAQLSSWHRMGCSGKILRSAIRSRPISFWQELPKSVLRLSIPHRRTEKQRLTIGRSGTSLAIHTKLDSSLRPTDSVRRSLDRLGRDSVELLYIHDSSEVLKPESRVVAEAASMVGTLVRTLGVSVYSEDEFDAALSDQRIGAIQAPINLLDRHIDRQRLDAAASRGVRVYARSVLLQGVLVAPPSSLNGPVIGTLLR